MEGLFLLGSLFGVLAFLFPTMLVLGLVIVLALRGDPDEGGGRAATLYLALATFVGVFTLLIANTALAASITDLVSNDDDETGASFESTVESTTDFSSGEISGGDFSSGDFSSDEFSSSDFEDFGGQDDDDRAITAIIQAMIGVAAALVVLWFHWPRLDAVRTSAVRGSAADRMRQAYCYTVCFTTVVTLLVATSVAVFAVVQAIAPETTGADNRGDALEGFVPLAVLSLGAAFIFRAHWSRLDLPAFLQAPPVAPESPYAPPPPPAT